MALTDEQVFAAADQMQRDGVKVTVRGLRDYLDGCGSLSTIHKAYQRWIEENKKAESIHEPIPKALMDRVTQLASAAWTDARLAANKVVEQERSALKSHRERLDADFSELVVAADESYAETIALRLRVEEQEQQIAKLRGEVAATAARLEEREQALAAERTERKDAQRELTEARVRVASLEAGQRELSA